MTDYTAPEIERLICKLINLEYEPGSYVRLTMTVAEFQRLVRKLESIEAMKLETVR